MPLRLQTDFVPRESSQFRQFPLYNQQLARILADLPSANSICKSPAHEVPHLNRIAYALLYALFPSIEILYRWSRGVQGSRAQVGLCDVSSERRHPTSLPSWHHRLGSGQRSSWRYLHRGPFTTQFVLHPELGSGAGFTDHCSYHFTVLRDRNGYLEVPLKL